MTDARGAFLLCPGCAGPMLPVRVESARVTVVVCEVCRGVWFDWFEGEASALARHLDTDVVLPAAAARMGACPRDGAPLAEHPYLDAGPQLPRCPTCLGLFARRAQIADLQRFHRNMPEVQQEPIERASLLARLWHAFAG